MNRLAGQTVLVVGAGTDVGRRIAIRMAEEGARVIATAGDIANLNGLIDQGVSEIRSLDVTDVASVYETADAIGSIDVLVNSGSYIHEGSVLDCDEVAWDYSFDVNVKAIHRTLRALLPSMAESRRGVVLNVAVEPTVDAARYAYKATLAAITAMSEAVATDFGDRGILARTLNVDAERIDEAADQAVDAAALHMPFTPVQAHAIEGGVSA